MIAHPPCLLSASLLCISEDIVGDFLLLCGNGHVTALAVAVDGKGQRFLYKGGKQGRSWTDWGILPYIEYEEESPVGLKTTFGIDISNYQRGMNLAQAKAEGVQFAVLKAGGADGGGSFPYYKDKSFENFYASACANGIPVGAYYFGHG